MSSTQQTFLFAAPNSRQRPTARKVHLRRLYDVLQFSLHRGDLPRARRAWAILVRCKEMHWKYMWNVAVQLVGNVQDGEDAEPDDERIAFLTIMMRQHPDQRESILRELILHMIHAGRHRKALDELDLYLPSFPYQDNPVLHLYAGLLAVYLAQPNMDASHSVNASPWDSALLRAADVHFERALAIDPDNVIALAWIEQLPRLSRPQENGDLPDTDDEHVEVDESKRPKRQKT